MTEIAGSIARITKAMDDSAAGISRVAGSTRCGVPAGICKLADLSGDYGKAFSRFPGPGCLQGGVQGNQSGL